jgi:hypothetical protein
LLATEVLCTTPSTGENHRGRKPGSGRRLSPSPPPMLDINFTACFDNSVAESYAWARWEILGGFARCDILDKS